MSNSSKVIDMYADVVVLTPGDPKRSVFTYLVPETIVAANNSRKKDEVEFRIHQSQLSVGFYVLVPYGKKMCRGILINLHHNKPEFETREIDSLLYHSPVITSSLIETSKWMASYYHEPLRNCIETILVFGKVVRIPKDKKLAFTKLPPVKLLEEQVAAFEKLIASKNKHNVFLLHGVTGSGKTEIYLRFIEEILNNDKQVIYLVPEIALTPQTIQRVEERFPGKTNVLNSQISDGERYRAFVESINGTKPIMIGSRSALFAPFPNLGAIIIDEEHDYSYKQDNSPHYHAVTTAVAMSEALGIPLVLGSATPRIEDYNRAIKGSWQLLSLTKRATMAALPAIHVVDMREELKKQNYSTLSDDLMDSLTQRLSKGEQSLLFLNKRGLASSLVCRACGWSAECPHCAVALSIHNNFYGVKQNMMLCHHCDYQVPIYIMCQRCNSLYIKPLGSGTERIEQDVLKLLPKARVLRMDRDTT
ncbi:MAG: primosomal protein N', partial [bacterium]|nr:primosomal protein N' [bacterium]